MDIAEAKKLKQELAELMTEAEESKPETSARAPELTKPTVDNTVLPQPAGFRVMLDPEVKRSPKGIKRQDTYGSLGFGSDDEDEDEEVKKLKEFDRVRLLLFHKSGSSSCSSSVVVFWATGRY